MCHFLNQKESVIFSFAILKNGKSRLFLLRVSHSKVLNAERIIEFHCASGVGLGMEAPDYQVGAHFEALDEGVLIATFKSIRYFVPILVDHLVK